MAIVYMNNQQSTINSAFVGENKIIAIYYNNQLLYDFNNLEPQVISYLLDNFDGFNANTRINDIEIRIVSSFNNTYQDTIRLINSQNLCQIIAVGVFIFKITRLIFIS